MIAKTIQQSFCPMYINNYNNNILPFTLYIRCNVNYIYIYTPICFNSMIETTLKQMWVSNFSLTCTMYIYVPRYHNYKLYSIKNLKRKKKKKGFFDPQWNLSYLCVVHDLLNNIFINYN